jgi:putative N-acetylmannosamine-6-phosphate epimerase
MSKLLHDGRHLLYSTEVAAKIGRNEAICLQQINYWMNINGGKIVDGVKWFWKTYQQWSEELQLSVSTVRRVIKKLKQLGLIAVDRLSAKTYYQANWYTLKIEAVQDLIQNEQIDAIALDSSMCSKSTDDIKDYPSKENSPQQHFADVEEKAETFSGALPPVHFVPPSENSFQEEEVDYEAPQITHCAGGLEPINSISVEDSNGDQFSGGEIEEENEDPCLGVIKKHWENVESAIARVKEAVNEGWCNNPTGLFINSCKNGEKPKNTINTDVKAWFEWARKERIVLAMSEGFVYTPDGKVVKISEIMQEYPIPN